MTTLKDIQAEIVFTRRRIREADGEIYNLIRFRTRLYGHLLSETARYQDALIYEVNAAQAEIETAVSEAERVLSGVAE